MIEKLFLSFRMLIVIPNQPLLGGWTLIVIPNKRLLGGWTIVDVRY